MKNLKKISISTFFKFFAFTAVLLLQFISLQSCFLLPKSGSKENETDYIVLCTQIPSPTPVLIDIQYNEREEKRPALTDCLPTPTALPTCTPNTINTYTPEITPFVNEPDEVKQSIKPSALKENKTKKTESAKPEPQQTIKEETEVIVYEELEKVEEIKEIITPIPKDSQQNSTPEPEKKKDVIDYKTSGKYTAEELELAARVAYFEAGNTEGRKAVLNVIYNRCISSKYGGKETSISTEVYRKSQFSVVNNSKFEEFTASNSLIKLADDVFNNGETILPENVLYFRNDKKGTEWEGKVYYGTFGGNAFFTAE